MEAWQIALIVIACVIVFILLFYLFLRWYTWRQVKQLNPNVPRVNVDLQKYSGKWYEIANIPKWFERGCKNTTALYVPNAEGLKVYNRCFADGEWKESVGQAYTTGIDGVLGVSFFPGIYGNYTVTYNDQDVSVVTNQDKSTLWILSRTPSLTSDKKRKVMDWLQTHQFPIDKLQWPQQMTPSEIENAQKDNSATDL